jgi:hypothetical protein
MSFMAVKLPSGSGEITRPASNYELDREPWDLVARLCDQMLEGVTSKPGHPRRATPLSVESVRVNVGQASVMALRDQLDALRRVKGYIPERIVMDGSHCPCIQEYITHFGELHLELELRVNLNTPGEKIPLVLDPRISGIQA